MRLPSLVAALLLFSWACTPAESDPPRPADVPGTWQTAASLTFGAHGVVKEGEGSVTAVLNLDGTTVLYETQVDTCNTYATMEVRVNGVPLVRVNDGGWSRAPRFSPRFEGDHGYGCFYPKFTLPCPDTRDTCFTRELFTATGTVDIAVTISGETRTFTAERWLGTRAIRLPSSAIVQGETVFVEAGPRGATDAANAPRNDKEGISFDYDDGRLNTAWCARKYNAKAWVTKKYDPDGACNPACCTSWDVVDVEPSDWTANGFSFVVPNDLPVGEGELGLSEFLRSVQVLACPFAECDVRVSRGSKIRTSVKVAATP